MEEATRLFYVGMTRAKKHLELIVYRERDGEKVEESQLVANVRTIMSPPNRIPKKETPEKITTTNKSKVLNSSTVAFEVPYNPNAIRNRNELALEKTIRHRVFGHGMIVNINEEQIRIKFEKGIKTLAIAVCLEMGLLEPAKG